MKVGTMRKIKVSRFLYVGAAAAVAGAGVGVSHFAFASGSSGIPTGKAPPPTAQGPPPTMTNGQRYPAAPLPGVPSSGGPITSCPQSETSGVFPAIQGEGTPPTRDLSLLSSAQVVGGDGVHYYELYSGADQAGQGGIYEVTLPLDPCKYISSGAQSSSQGNASTYYAPAGFGPVTITSIMSDSEVAISGSNGHTGTFNVVTGAFSVN